MSRSPDLRRIRPAPTVLTTDLGDELVVLDPDTGSMFSLNATGRVVWRELGTGSAAELAEKVSAAFDVDVARAAADIEQLVGELLLRGLALELPERST